MIKIAVSQFINTKLENAKSVKNSMTDQQQNSDDIINLFDMLSMSNLLNQALFNEASSSESELSTFYQCLDHSHVNV